ncbi:hypothetical protein LO80_00055 [Candidatus Francisella endociliophora]|uniref:Uncharacterized protein n=1 Tax=Candidatus Francisella endociliophora TaxID=653937 RepID=A0A097ELV2_9GAMM|nr:hypothetical protein [Francisella sp. FSC1006]AIT08518.1 hypothetical protein LO80_00055 [Francisella sp. FSC1006]
MKKIFTFTAMLISMGISSLYAENIVYIGYGSLIEDPRELPIKEGFKQTDLKLPIDFLRISGSYIGNSSKHDDTLYGAFCNKKDPDRKNSPLYLSVTIAPDEFAKDVKYSNVYSAQYDVVNDKFKELAIDAFDSARKALMRREGTTVSDNIAFISKSDLAPDTKEKIDNYKISKNATQLSEKDKENIITWMKEHGIDTTFITYFPSNFHDTIYGRGMETIAGKIKGMNSDRDITKWNQDNIRLLMFLVANNQANMASTRYNALEKFRSYIYEVPANVKNNTTYWQIGPYAKTAGLSGLITDVFNYPRIHTRKLEDSNAYVDCSDYKFESKDDSDEYVK